MLLKNLLFIFILLQILPISAQSVLGKWKTIDDETGEEKSIVEIFEKDGKIFGKVIEVLRPQDKNKKCTLCEGQDKDKPIVGLIVIKGLAKKNNEFKDGKILDPKTGKLYQCIIKLLEKNKLSVRGYIGIPMMGRTQNWVRVN